MKRRKLIQGMLAFSIGWAARAGAQTQMRRLPRVIVVTAGDETGFRPFEKSFLQGMRAAGQTEGATFILEVRYANLEPARSVGLIRDAVAARPDVLVVSGLTNARRARDATKSVPVVVATSSDLADAGVVTSLARPGANITGISDLGDEAAVKRLELLKELLPKASRIALLNNPDFPATAKIESRIEAAAKVLKVTVNALYAKDRASLAAVLDSLQKSSPDALLIGGDALFVVNAKQVIERATALRIPVVHYWPGTVEMGALFSYQADIHKNYERAAFYVDRILKGTKPQELPIEQPTRYELVINRKVMTALGFTIPATVMLRADRIIE